MKLETGNWKLEIGNRFVLFSFSATKADPPSGG